MTTQTTQDLTIIGIGSSAGGLEAIRELVATLPVDVPAAYVVVQHMSPHHKSLMTELVARQTQLKVGTIQNGTIPEANVVYITPPKSDVIFSDGRLHLLQDPNAEPGTPRPSVDRFLVSLAEQNGDNSMAIILSGTGSDGAYGVQAIREAGGITIAQDAESAKYDGMPVAAVQTGCVDLVLRPQDIGANLQKILSSPRDFTSFRHENSLRDSPVSDLLQILLARTRVDFRDYKQTTISRRIERRMIALGIETQEEYTQFCRNNPHAVDALFKDLLISVTRFFRDREEFELLKALLPQLIKERGPGPLRIWVAGCATGEEAYSIAMVVSEALGNPTNQLKSRVQIFATDIDKDALKTARKGVYSLAALNDIPSELADKYLIRQTDGVRVVDNLRNAVLFSDHNVCQDPPFQKVDLICCRNLLIYFGNPLQQKVMSRFHYAMSPHGLLFLGTAESVAGSDELFVQDRSASHVYRKRSLRAHQTQQPYNMPSVPMMAQRPTIKPPAPQGPSTDRQLFEALAQSLGKNSLLVTEDFSIARVYGSVSQFIEVNETSSLRMHLDLLRSPLREEARSLITIALKNGAHKGGVRHLLAENDDEEIRLDVYPIIAKDISERAALVVFTPVTVDRSRMNEAPIVGEEGDATFERIRNLENEVATTREALQQTIEELETSNEELQSLNEELQSTNEELQATNEELETSNEELQSTNEELITVNEELQVTASELSGRTGELISVLESTPLAIVVADSALQITQATLAATRMFNIRRPISSPHISQCALPEGFPILAPICSEALRLGQTVTEEFTSKGTRIRLTCSPYFDVNGQILGVTMVVSEFPGMAHEMEMILDNSKLLLLNRTRNGEILRISSAYAELLGLSRGKALSKNLFSLASDAGADEQMLKEDAKVLDSKDGFDNELLQVSLPDGEGDRWISMDRHRFPHHITEEPTVFTIGTDVTETVEARERAEALLMQAELVQDMVGIGFWSIDADGQTPYWSPKVYEIHGVKPEEYSPEIDSAIAFFHPDDREDVQRIVSEAIETGNGFSFIKRLIRPDGVEIQVESQGMAIRDDNGDVTRLVGIFREAQETDS
ncbi:chemotaxis protein CheB [Phaeobacter inhibens]|uniref:chemotaxis protein CheB n=1 Tax=Phaeobacter inhibens TaxID=221822 RepID=UPI000971A8A6|nr:chemotaxis protein CheB [Phaeobacter inhibens]APX14822.1 PAS domain S-box protein [Phaeobacter inhibens]UWR97778.1 PAS domain-containing protein [Phaeobacter inhibens]